MKKIIAISILIFNIVSLNLVSEDSVDNSSYILMDAESGRIYYEKNKDQRYLTASIAKIMTCLVAIENGSLFTTYKVDYETTLTEGSSIYLKEDDEIFLYDLLCGLMLRSGNDAATMISKVVFKTEEEFIFNMNQTAKRIGMGNSTFENPTGLNRDSYNYSTAFDMALLMKYAIQNEVFYDISTKKFHKAETTFFKYHWNNKHKLITGTDYVKSGKTGYTKDSGRTLVSYAEIDNMKLIAVSFNENNHYELHNSLFQKATKEFSRQKIIDKGVYRQELDNLDYYPMVNEDVFLYIKNDSDIYLKFNLYKEVTNTCGYLEIYEDEKLIFRDSLYPYYPKS